MKSDNLQLPCGQTPTSSYMFPLPHCRYGRHGHGGHGGHDGCGGRCEHGGHGQDGTGRDKTGKNCHLNLTFQVICDWQLSQFLCFLVGRVLAQQGHVSPQCSHVNSPQFLCTLNCGQR